MHFLMNLFKVNFWVLSLCSPLTIYAEVLVEEHKTATFDETLIYPQYSDSELINQEFKVRNQLESLGERPKDNRTGAAMIGMSISAVSITSGTLLIMVDQQNPFYNSSQSLAGLALLTVSAALLPTSIYYYVKSAEAYDRKYTSLDQKHQMVLKAIDQRKRISVQKNAKMNDDQNPSDDETKILKLKEKQPWSYHQRAWLALGTGSLIITKGYLDYQDDPDKSKIPLYLSLGLGSALALTGAYLFVYAYGDYVRSEHSQNFGTRDHSRPMNTWIAPSLIDRDWALSMGFQFN